MMLIDEAKAMLKDLTPLKTDCGQLCGARCCGSMEGEETGMLLFPGEEEAYTDSADYRIRKAEAGSLLICDGHCDRDTRPFSCMIFPLLPVVREDGIHLAVDERARAVCPLCRERLSAFDPEFKEALKEACTMLLADPEQKNFLTLLTEEQDAMKELRKRLSER